MISIGIPFYNNESTLADAIRSVFAQTERDWELILFDDGSTDGSLGIAEQVQDPRVRVFRDHVNRGLPTRLNQIAKLARGEYLARMDADDLMHPERLAKQLKVLEERPELDLVGASTYSLDRADCPRGMRGGMPPETSALGQLKRTVLIHATILSRTEWSRRNPYDQTRHRSEDHDLYVRCYPNLSFGQVNECLYFYREEYSVQLNKYLASCRCDRSIFLKYGPAMVGWFRTIVLCLASLLKGEVYRIFSVLGLQQLLVRRRNRSMSDEERQAARKVLEAIVSTPVPGLPEGKTVARRETIVFGMNTLFSVRHFLPEILASVRERGFRAVVIAPGPPEPGEEPLASCPEVEFRFVPVRREIAPIADLYAIWRIWLILKSVRPAVVEMSTPKMALLGGLAAWLARVPHRIYTLRGLRYETARSGKRWLLMACERVACACAHQVICISHSVRRTALADRIAPAGKTILLGSRVSEGITLAADSEQEHGRDISQLREQLGIPPDAPIIGFVGRLTRDKGICELVKCLHILNRQGHGARLLLLGDFESGDPVAEATRDFIQTSRSVHWLGYVPDPKPYYRLMDVFVFPTHREGLGKVLLEAADAGKPVISTFTTGVVDVVQNGVTGLLVPPRDAEALANAVSALLNDRAMAARMGAAARQLVHRHFDNTIYLERRLTLLDSLLRGGVPANSVQDGEEHCVLPMHP